jgi:HK97 gp10 family phage protein
MASRTSFRLDGGKELEQALKQLGPEVATKVGASGLRQATNILRNGLRAAAPVGRGSTKKTWKTKAGTSNSADYGHLRDNIKTKKQRSRSAHSLRFIVTTGNAFWGKFLEFGTRKMSAKTWFKPAVDRIMPRAAESIVSEVRKAIDRAARKAAR